MGKVVSSQSEDVVSLKEIILKIQFLSGYLLKKWPIILIALIIGAAGGYLKVRNEAPFYTATCTFVLENGQASSQPMGLAALLSGATGGNSGSLFQGSTLIALYKTRLMLEKTLLSSAEFNGKKELLINKYLKINKQPENWETLSATTKSQLLPDIIGEVANNYLKITSGDMIFVEVKSKDELFSKALAENLIETVNNFYIYTKTKKSLENIAILQKQADSLRRVLTSSMNNTAASADANPNANAALKILQVPAQRRAIDVQSNSTIYSTVSANLETTKLELRRETPLIQIIDRPALPLQKTVPNKVKSILIFGILAMLIASIFLIVRLFYKRMMLDDNI